VDTVALTMKDSRNYRETTVVLQWKTVWLATVEHGDIHGDCYGYSL